MTTLEAIRARLVAASSVTDLVNQRVYPQVMPQPPTLPAVVITVVAELPQNSFTGAAATRLLEARVQIDCYAKTYLEAHQVADAVDAVVADLNDVDLSATRESAQDLYENETQLHRVLLDYLVWR